MPRAAVHTTHHPLGVWVQRPKSAGPNTPKKQTLPGFEKQKKKKKKKKRKERKQKEKQNKT